VQFTLAGAALSVLDAADPAQKVSRSRAIANDWRAGRISEVGTAAPPDRPARPDRPEIAAPGKVKRRRINRGREGRVALLHALAHIELNAIDLAWDIVARFSGEELPRNFFDDWVTVAAEEATHFQLLSERLAELDAAYGDLPAHGGLWEAAEKTAHDLLARIAIVPLVLEARGLDVTPAMIEKLRAAEDEASAEVLEVIYRDEIGHVAIGRRWFGWLCQERGLDPVGTWQDLVKTYFTGDLKPPFNEEGRKQADFPPEFYLPIAGSS
jgi:uncharacterized ferritin-like protein (DUF455 family)